MRYRLSAFAGAAVLSWPLLVMAQSTATSFEGLQAALTGGPEVIVRDAEGRKTRGRVSSVSQDQIVIKKNTSAILRLFGRSQERTFPADAVTRIEIVDSTWNGALVGAAVAPFVVLGIHGVEEAAVSDSNDMKGIWTLVLGSMSVVLCIEIGREIDSRINDPIYERPSQQPQVAIGPLLGRGRVGVMARVSF